MFFDLRMISDAIPEHKRMIIFEVEFSNATEFVAQVYFYATVFCRRTVGNSCNNKLNRIKDGQQRRS
jgi:hypothetical protein